MRYWRWPWTEWQPLRRNKSMNANNWFDDVSRSLASPVSRRGVLRLFVGGLASATLASLGLGWARAGNIPEKGKCTADSDCQGTLKCCGKVCCKSSQCCKNKTVCCSSGQACCPASANFSGTTCCQSNMPCCGTASKRV